MLPLCNVHESKKGKDDDSQGIGSLPLLDCTVIATHTLWRNFLITHSVMSILRLFSARWQSRRSRRARSRQRPTSSESEERSRSCLPSNTQTSFTSTKVSTYSIQLEVETDNCLHFAVFENKEKMVLVMEIAAGGELYDYISDRKTLGEPDARRIFRQIATAIYYCHKVGTKLISNFKWILALSR